MRDVRRPWSLRCLLPVVVAVVAAVPLTAPTALAEEAGAPVPTGTTLVGELVQAFDDPHPAEEGAGHGTEDDGSAGLLSWVETAPGETVRVPTEDVADIEAGSTVEVTLGAEVRDEASAAGLEPAQDVLASEVVAAPAEQPTAPAAGPVNHQVTVVLMVPKDAAADATTPADVQASVDGAVAAFWSEQTGGQARFGVVATLGWGQATVGCDDPFGLWQQAAGRAGWTSGPGKHLLVYVPNTRATAGCSYGLGTVGRGITDGGLSYVKATETSVIAHEFGHNLGLGHSSAVQCAGAVETGDCRTVSYGDYYDVMGVSWEQTGTLSAVHAALLGVLPPEAVTSVTPDDPVTDVTLTPASSRSGMRAVELVDSDGDHYLLEFREASGRDAWLGDPTSNWPGLQRGVTVRRAAEGIDDTSLLLDGSPSARSGWSSDRAVALPVGTAVPVAGGEFQVTVSGVPTGSATLRVQTPAGIVEGRYAASGGPSGPLGSPTAALGCGLRSAGCSRTYQFGAIYWSPSSGAQVVNGAIRGRWASLGAEGGFMGYPTAGEVCGLRGGGCSQSFQVGTVVWSPSSGAQVVNGAIRGRWASLGAEGGFMGYPIAGEVCGLRGGGCSQSFQVGTVVWSPSSGAQVVNGAIRGRWASLGAEGGFMGYPIAGEVCGLRGGGCSQSFQVGTVVWSPSSGAQVVNGAIRGRWASLGAEGGYMGYPIAGEVCGLRGGGCLQHFSGGSVYWSPTTGAHPVNGAIFGSWGGYRWETGVLGYPVEAPRSVPEGVSQRFQGGQLTWVAATGQVRRS